MDEMTSARSDPIIAIGRWWRHVIEQVEHREVVHRVIEEAVWSPRYLFMVLMSAGIALLGLLLSSPAVVIGAMLISPLMGPILGVGFALAVFDLAELRRSATALALGAAIAVAFAALIVAVSPIQEVTPEIAARTRPNLFDLLVALFSAMAGAYAMIRGRSGTIVGVAIATALMPPLAVVGFGLATWNHAVFFGALLLFVTNMITIALTATAMARIYGFGSRLSPTQTRFQAALLIAVLIILSVPLAIALRQIGWETVASRQIRDGLLAPFPKGSRTSQVDIAYDAPRIRVRAVVLTPKTIGDIDASVTAALEKRLHRDIDLHIDQLRIDPGPGGADTAEIAAAKVQIAATPDPAVLLRDRLATVTGVPPDQVTIDAQQRRAIVRAPVLPGATLATWHALETRANAGLDEWRAQIIPPVEPLPDIAFSDGQLDDPATLDLAAWSVSRIGLPVQIEGGDEAEAGSVADAVTARGGVARMGTHRGGPVRLEWVITAP